MFSLLRSQGESKAVDDAQPASPQPHTTFKQPSLTQRKGRQTAPAAVTSASVSSSLSATVSPARIAVINFRRLLSRVERRVAERSRGTAEEKETGGAHSVREQTLLIKSLHSLKAQLEAIQPHVDKAEMSEYVQRVSRLWGEAHVDPLHLRQRPPSFTAQPSLLSVGGAPAPSRPLLPIVSSSTVVPSAPHASASASASSVPYSAAPSSAHPIADASLFTAQHVRPSPPNPALVKAQLFAKSSPAVPASPTSSSSTLSQEHEAGLTALSLLAPQLKEQVKAIAAHLHVDEGVVADTSMMLEANVDSVRRENVRLKGWARASCSETCWMTSTIVMVLLAFAFMVGLMKFIPKPRS